MSDKQGISFFYSSRFSPAILFILALALRLILLGHKSLWVDEAYAAGLMDLDIHQLLEASFRGSPHPPLAFLAIKLSSILFGNSEFGLRMIPGIMSSLATIPLFLFVKKLMGFKTAFYTGLVWVVCPYAVSLGQEAWLYGTLAFIGFLFVYVAELAWEGNRSAFWFVVPVGIVGMLVQHLFLFFIIAGFLIYFTVEKNRRIKFRYTIILAGVLLLLYLPFVSGALEQASLRAARLSASGFLSTAPTRMLLRIPTVFARLIPGGLVRELNQGLLNLSVRLAAFLLFCCVTLLSLLFLLLDRKISRSFKIWAIGIFIFPLLMFINEDPTVRHLSILWLPFSVGLGALFKRFRYSGPVIVILTILLLYPYYSLDSFPYHRSNWRDAVLLVQKERTPDESLLVMTGQNCGLIYDYYATDGLERVALGGENPYAVQAIRGTLDPESILDSLLATSTGTWIISDYWGGQSAMEIASGYDIVRHHRIGETMEVLLIEN